jgi:hypothetical protein
MKSPTSTSALPGCHVEDNLVRPVAAPALGGQTYQMQVRTYLLIGLSNRGFNCLLSPGSIPDYPPPSFDEAIAAAAADRNASPVSPAGSTTTHSSSSDRRQPAPILIPPLPRTQNQPVVTRTLPDSSELSESVRYSTQAECDSDSDDGDLEVISTSDATSPTTPSEQDSPRHPTPGTTRLGSWTALASGDTMHPSPSQLTLTPHLNDTSQGGDDQSIASPSTDSQAGDSLIARNSTPSPVPPKRRLHLLSGFLKSRDNYTSSAPATPTYATASQLSLPLNHPGSPSKPHRGESLIARKLFGHKGKERSIDPDPEGPPEPLETWDMLSDVERDVPPASSIPEQFPCSPGPSAPGLRLLSTEPRRQGARSKHRSLLNHRVLPPPLPLASAGQRHLINSSTDVDPREPVVPVPSHQELLAPAPLATSSAPPAVPIPSSPSERPSIQSMHALLKPSVAVDNPTRGRTLRATSSMVWASGRRNSPVPSPTRTVTAPTSPCTASMMSSVANVNVDHDTDTHAITVARDDPEGAVPPSPVQEEEEERFVTPPGSPVRSLAALPLANRSRHPSPVRHESRPGVSLRDDGPVPLPLGNPTRSDPHSRLARTPIITPRPSASALHTFAPSNPSPLSNQSFERQAAISPPLATTLPTIENMAAPRRDTVVSIGDTESLIELYVSSPGPTTTIPAASSVTRETATATSDPADRAPTPTDGADSNQYHYPGRPLPHPPGASQSGPVRPVLLDLFLAGNIPPGLPPYTEVELGEQRSASAFSSHSQPKQNPCAICLPSPPLFSQPGAGYIPPPIPPPGLLAMLDDDVMSEPSSPGSTYEMPSSPSVPLAVQREFTSLEALETRSDDYDSDGGGNVADTTTGSNREARHLTSALAPYCVADPRTSTMTEHVSGTEYQGPRAPGIDNKDDGAGDRDACGGRAVQRERGTTGPSPGGTTASHAQRACEAQVGSAWNDCGSMRSVQDAVPRQ